MTDRRRAFAAILLLFLLCGITWWSAMGGERAAREPDAPPAPAAPGPRPPTAAPRPAPTRPRAAPASTAEPPKDEAPRPAAVVPVPAAPAASTAPVRGLSASFLRRLEPRRPPPGVREIPEGGKLEIPEPKGPVIGTGPGGMSPVGWSRWKPVPPKGGVTYRGRVTDADGRPVDGADVLRVELDEQGSRASPSSYQWIRQAARTSADGTFEAASQPDGSFLLAANWHARLNGPRGLDLVTAVPVKGSGSEIVPGIELRLPFAVASLGGVRGKVVDADGAPLRNALVATGFQQVRTDAQGRFALSALDPGESTITFQASGFGTREETVAVRAGSVAETTVTLDFAVKGALEIAGRVLDEEGKPVAGAPVFLGAGTREGVRWGKTDEAGAFVFARLPDAWAKSSVQVMVSPVPDRDRILPDKPAKVTPPDASVVLTVRRTTPLRLLVRSAADGSPIAHFNVEVRAEAAGAPPRQISSASCYDEGGAATFHVPKGRIVLDVEAKAHGRAEFAVDVPDTAGPHEVVVTMARE